MKIASDIMTTRLKMVASGDSLETVLRMFLEQGITSSPVINPLGEVLGILSEMTLTKAFMLHKGKLHKSDKVGHHVDLLDPVNIVYVDSPIGEVLREMIASPTHRLLVKDRKDRFVGIISPKDMMRGMLGEVNPTLNLKDRLRETEFRLRESMSKLKDTEASLEIYQHAFHETPYLMHAVDEHGQLIIVNKREHDALGYEEGELVGKSIFDLYAKSMHAEAQAGLKRVIETGFHHVTYTTLVKKDGSSFRCDIASAAIFNADNKFVSTISVLRPVDGDELLRTLNGIVNDKTGPLSPYSNLKD